MPSTPKRMPQVKGMCLGSGCLDCGLGSGGEIVVAWAAGVDGCSLVVRTTSVSADCRGLS
eukprot:scaffold98290_cov23-Tisochrysis_lutea.AAC.1